MNTKCFLLGFAAVLMATQAEDRNSRTPRRYQPNFASCSDCRRQHRYLLLPLGGPKSPKLRKCFSSSEVEGSTNLRSVLPKSPGEAFVLVTAGEDTALEPQLLSVMAERLGNVSVVLPKNGSRSKLSKRCRSLGTACHELDSLAPVLEEMEVEERVVMESVFGMKGWGTGDEKKKGVDEESFLLHRQLERLIGKLCNRDKTRNKLIEIRKESRSGVPSVDYSNESTGTALRAQFRFFETINCQLYHKPENKGHFCCFSDLEDDFKFGLSLKDILPFDSKSYDKNRPPKLGGKPTIVYFHVTVLSLDSINEESMTYVADIFLAQSWRDPRLRLPESMSQQYRILDVDWLHDIWRPDSFFKNAKQVTFHEISIPNHYVWLYHDKTLLYMSKLTLVLSCAMKFESYPHDIQVCSIMIESLSHTVQDLIFLWNLTDPLVLNPEIELPQLDIASNYTTDCTVQYSTGNFTCLAVVFTLKRRLGYHLLHTYIPSALIVVMSWISFWIKPEAIPARVTLGVTSLLTLGESLFLFLMNILNGGLYEKIIAATQNTQSQQNLPPVSYVKAIDIWMSSCSVFVFLSLMEFAIVNNYMGPISAKAIVGYSEEDLRTTVEDYRLQSSLGKNLQNPTCYGKEAALCIDRFSRYFFPFSFFILNVVYWSIFL